MRTFFTLGVAAVALIGLMLIVRSERPAPPPGHDVVAAEAYWTARIKAIGGAPAYREFADFVRDMNASDQHGLAHAFGGALYHAAGLSGVSVCDAQFSYGCYHQFIGSAIAAQGLSVVNEIDRTCKTLTASGPCEHGIGHGLVGYLGYDPASLKKAITECDSIDAGGGSLQGCAGGAFMEYNMRTLAGSHAERTGTSDPYEPCNAYTGVTALSCYLYQPQWWSSQMGLSSTTKATVVAKMIARCMRLRGDAASTCIRGVGEMVPPYSDYRARDARDLCDFGSADHVVRLECAEGAAIVLDGVGHQPEAKDLCMTFAGTDQASCMLYATGKKML